jgi:hypothetical protein
MKMEQTECSETSAYKIQTPGNHPEGNIQHTEHGESLKSKTLKKLYSYVYYTINILNFSWIWRECSAVELETEVLNKQIEVTTDLHTSSRWQVRTSIRISITISGIWCDVSQCVHTKARTVSEQGHHHRHFLPIYYPLITIPFNTIFCAPCQLH